MTPAQLITQLQQAALSLQQTMEDWQANIAVPTLKRAQQNTINLLLEAVSLLQQQEEIAIATLQGYKTHYPTKKARKKGKQ